MRGKEKRQRLIFYGEEMGGAQGGDEENVL